ncbi:MAG: asparaginase [bacterium]|nr:asparaginase [bacterium]
MLPRDPENPASPLVPRPFADSLAFNPGLEAAIRGLGSGIDFDVDRDVRSIDPPIDSAAVRPEHWVELARLIEREIEGYDGVVVIHGTDTMAYTASALAFLFENLAKPVVLTGSQMPLFRTPSDARNNLLNAIEVAAHSSPGVPIIPEVLIVFGDRILRGCQATKVSSSARNAFASLNGPDLGEIEPGRIRVFHGRLRHRPDPAREPFSVRYEMFAQENRRARVIGIELTPDLHLGDLAALLALPDLVGVILHTYGVGNAPPDPELYALLRRAADAGCLIVNVSQCLHGQVQMGRYASSSELSEYGVASGMDMTDETARIKIYWALATQVGDARRTQMQISQRGEQTEDLFDVAFGPVLDPADVHVAGARFDARFEPANLRQAVLRLGGARFVREAGTAAPAEPCVHVFLNDPRASRESDPSAARCIATWTGAWDAEAESWVEDVTDGLGLLGEGEVYLTLVCPPGVRIVCRGVFLALFARIVRQILVR